MKEIVKPRNPLVDNIKFTKSNPDAPKKFNSDLDEEVDVISSQEIKKYIHNLGRELKNNEAEKKEKKLKEEQVFAKEVTKAFKQMQQMEK